jgi:hypothetical protein
MHMSKFQKMSWKLFTGISVGFASSLAFKTHVLRSDDNHSPLEANMVRGTRNRPVTFELQESSACSCSCHCPCSCSFDCHQLVTTWNVWLQVILFAFASYFIADGQKQSGIVSVLFCGMVRSCASGCPTSC